MTDVDVVVIGAGVGGLCAGSLLAHKGKRVVVLEQAERVGGCCSTFEKDGYKIDLGASIIEFPQVINWAFERMGTTFFDEVDLVPVDPTYTAILHDGTKVSFPIDLEKCEAVIKSFAPDQLDGWRRYSKTIDGFLRAALDGFFLSPARNTRDVFRLFAKTPALLKYGSLFMNSYEGVLRRFFSDERLLEAFSFQSFYAGLPPAILPGHFAMLPYGEHFGIYYARGGMIGVPRGFQRCGERAGMKVELGCKVDKLISDDGCVKGVRLQDGTVITADIVISNINAKKLYLDMVEPGVLPNRVIKGLESYRYSMATPMLYLCLDEAPPLEGHHTLMTLPMKETNAYWFDHYEHGHFPEEQFGILSWTTHSDPSLAPEGKHIVAVTLAPGPYRLAGTSWDEEKPCLKSAIIDHLEERYLPELSKHIVHADLSTPVDFERMLLSPEGAIYALRQDLFNSLVFRPSAESQHLKGLYLVGASTHPGGGIPTVTASGMIAADLIEQAEKEGVLP